jgi:AraC-like DNA-binding protein
MIVIKIPYDLLASRFGSIDDFVTLQVDGTRGGGAILASFVRKAWAHCVELGNSDTDRGGAMIRALLDLMALVRDGGTEGSLMPGSAALHEEMRAYVQTRLADPSLSVSSLAHAFGVTPRHVHRVFAAFGMTPSNYILEGRLNLAAASLRDIKGTADITHVGLDSGFSDSTTFSRAFRKRYGVSPRDYRRERRSR